MRPLWLWLPPLAWAAVIFASSHISLPPGPPLPAGLDKVAHFLLYAVLALLLLRPLLSQAISPTLAAVYCLLLTLAYAALDELHQNLISWHLGNSFRLCLYFSAVPASRYNFFV